MYNFPSGKPKISIGLRVDWTTRIDPGNAGKHLVHGRKNIQKKMLEIDVTNCQ